MIAHDVLPLIDAALRVHAPTALESAGLVRRADSLRRLARASERNLSYASDVAHAAFAEARRLAHAAMVKDDLPRAHLLGWAASAAHAAADACAVGTVAVVTPSPGLHWADAARRARQSAAAAVAQRCPVTDDAATPATVGGAEG